jgi:hypothetical protein
MKTLTLVIFVAFLCACSPENQSTSDSKQTTITTLPIVSSVSTASSVDAASDVSSVSSVQTTASGAAPASAVASVSAQLSNENHSTDNAADGDVVSINTKYGLVEYQKNDSSISVNGETVYDEANTDVMAERGNFQLSNEEVILFEGGSTGSGTLDGETFFLILKPDHSPAIVKTPISSHGNEVKRAWQVNEVIYVDFNVGSYDKIKPPLKLVSDKVVVTESTPAPYVKNGPRLKDDDCSSLYGISKESCSNIRAQYNKSCVKTANASAGMIGSNLADMGNFKYLSGLLGFNETEFNRSCLAWCKGGDVSFEQFSKSVCNASKTSK